MTPLLYKYVQRSIDYFPNEKEINLRYNVLLYTRLYTRSHFTLSSYPA